MPLCGERGYIHTYILHAISVLIWCKDHYKIWLCSDNPEGRGYLGDLVMDWRVITKWGCRLQSRASGLCQIVGLWEYGNEFHNIMEYFDHPSINFWRNNFAAWNPSIGFDVYKVRLLGRYGRKWNSPHRIQCTFEHQIPIKSVVIFEVHPFHPL
jgi:hypothetical protein